MNLTDKVADLSHSKKLIEAGIKLETEFWWRSDGGKEWSLFNKENVFISTSNLDYYIEAYPAPLPCELMEKLPAIIKEQEKEWWLTIQKVTKNYYTVDYPEETMKKTLLSGGDKTLANALADMLVYLKENKLLEEKE